MECGRLIQNFNATTVPHIRKGLIYLLMGLSVGSFGNEMESFIQNAKTCFLVIFMALCF
jgi:hypothetical protein